MIESSDAIETPPPKRQFTIRAVLFATMLVAIAAAGFSGLIRADDDDLPIAFVLFVVAAPLALVLILSLARTIERFTAMRRRQRETNPDA
ncbi:MAG: hypothetical protein WD894_21010 [Pirellulales bacterium]